MKIIIIDGVAFRLTKSGIMESTFATVDLPGWGQHAPEEIGLSGGELDTIRQTLARLAQVYPEGRTGLPRSEPKKTNAVVPEQPV